MLFLAKDSFVITYKVTAIVNVYRHHTYLCIHNPKVCLILESLELTLAASYKERGQLQPLLLINITYNSPIYNYRQRRQL